MSIEPLLCPNCGAKLSPEKPQCDYCGIHYIVKSGKPLMLDMKKVETQQIKYGKIGLRVEDVKSLGKFVLEQTVTVSYTLFYVFRFQLFKQIKRGDTIVKANVYGYAFTNPIKGIINQIFHKDKGYPEPHDFKDGLQRECVRIIQANAYEDKPSLKIEGQTLEIPTLVPVESMQKDVFNWITQNLVVSKTYTIRSAKGYDLGIRTATFTFKKKDFVEFVFVGCFAVPTFHLAYKHPDSTKTFKRELLGYSGEILIDEIKCSKIKMFGKECDNFPDFVCSVCGNLYCGEHQKQCEKCGISLCKDCIVSKGFVFKHYFCPKCVGS